MLGMLERLSVSYLQPLEFKSDTAQNQTDAGPLENVHTPEITAENQMGYLSTTHCTRQVMLGQLNPIPAIPKCLSRHCFTINKMMFHYLEVNCL